MFVCKFNCFIYCISQSDGVVDCRTSIVCMASPVDFTAFNHHEEAFFVVRKNFNTLVYIIGQSPFTVCTVIFIGDGVAVCQFFADQQNLFIFVADFFCFSLSVYYFVSSFFCSVIQAFFVAVSTVWFEQCAACKVIKVRSNQFFTDFIVVVSACLMAVESSWSCMVEVYRRYNTDVIAFISELLCNCFVFYCHGLIHVDGAGIGLVSGRNGSCCRSRVWAERCGIVSYCGTCYWEVHKGQCFVAVQNIIVICVCYCTQIVRSCLELWVAHTITDEQEYIFWFFGSRCCCFVAQNATAVCLHARYCGRNTCRFYVWRCSIYTA